MQNLWSRLSFACLAVLLFLSSCKKSLYTQLKSEVDDVIETVPPKHTAISSRINDNCRGFYETLPSRYDSSNKKYPLILFIHGIGELGNGSTDLPKMLRAGLPRLINRKKFPASFEVAGKNYSFIVISPQFRKRPTNAEVDDVLNYALKKYRIDPSRVYITGLSMGGGVTWEYSAEYGSRMAAAAPVCGGSWPDQKRAASIAEYALPVWAFHNADDKVVPPSYTREYVNLIKESNGQVDAKFTIWPSGGHDSWTKAYDPAFREAGKNMYEWMLTHSR